MFLTGDVEEQTKKHIHAGAWLHPLREKAMRLTFHTGQFTVTIIVRKTAQKKATAQHGKKQPPLRKSDGSLVAMPQKTTHLRS